MEPATLAVVLINKEGVITGLDGDAGRLGLDKDVIGKPWQTAFRGWEMPPAPSSGTHSLPFRVESTAPSGHPVCAEFYRLPIGAEPGTITAILSADGITPLTDRQQQLSGLGELSAGVAHEINNALTLLRGWLDLMHSDMDDDNPNKQTMELLIGESDRIGRLTGNLLQVARSARETEAPLNLRSLVDDVVNLVQYEMKNSAIEIENCLPDDLPAITGSSGRLKQALLNLLMNARQAMPSGGKVTISAAVDENQHVQITIEDTGCGMSMEVKKKVFSPFFTTKANGTGLGLPVTRKIIEDHGGSVHLESEANTGTRFTLRLPVEAVAQ